MNQNDILAELETAFKEIPFENSAFQNRAFVMAQQGTPGRAYRAIGLRMFAKIRALKGLQFSRRKEDIDIEELKAKISSARTSDFDRQRAEIDIEEKLDSRAWTDKLAGDAMAELETMYAEFKKFPAYTRETFEMEELSHFERRLSQSAQIGDGARSSMAAIENLSQFDNLLETAHNQLKGAHDAVRID